MSFWVGLGVGVGLLVSLLLFEGQGSRRADRPDGYRTGGTGHGFQIYHPRCADCWVVVETAVDTHATDGSQTCVG
jgi:hypothetical protein